MKKFPNHIILSTAKRLLEDGIETNRKNITFPVTFE